LDNSNPGDTVHFRQGDYVITDFFYVRGHAGTATGIPSDNLSGDPILANRRGQDAAAAMLLPESPAIDRAIAGAPAQDYAHVKKTKGLP
jgi:hypothetical protein